jgi:hypothetical protein
VDPVAKATILRVHVPIAVGVLALMILRIVWWWGFDRKPTAVAGSPRWQERTAQVVHVLFYIIILGMSERARNDGAERRSATDLWRRERPTTAGPIEVFVRQQIAAGAAGTVEAAMAHMRADHTSAEDAGRIAQEAGVKTLVLSHIGPPTVSDAACQAAAGKYFIGEIIVGHDLAVI